MEKEIKTLKTSEQKQENFNCKALLIVHYSDKTKSEYYIASGKSGVSTSNILYNYSCAFMASICEFLPLDYYYNESENYFLKFCDENSLYSFSDE